VYGLYKSYFVLFHWFGVVKSSTKSTIVLSRTRGTSPSATINQFGVSLSGTNWKICLYSFFVIEADHILSGDENFMLSEGYMLNEFNMSTRQIQGSLYSLTPVSDFPEILPNSTRDLTNQPLYFRGLEEQVRLQQ
jgi:hypothetical protein